MKRREEKREQSEVEVKVRKVMRVRRIEREGSGAARLRSIGVDRIKKRRAGWSLNSGLVVTFQAMFRNMFIKSHLSEHGTRFLSKNFFCRSLYVLSLSCLWGGLSGVSNNTSVSWKRFYIQVCSVCSRPWTDLEIYNKQKKHSVYPPIKFTWWQNYWCFPSIEFITLAHPWDSLGTSHWQATEWDICYLCAGADICQLIIQLKTKY